MTTGDDLDAADRQLVLAALTTDRGFYTAERASQLSGVPLRTVYHWATTGTLVPDHALGRPKRWSYRDLVLLRLIAFLRQRQVELTDAAGLASQYRAEFASGRAGEVETRVSAAQGGYQIGAEMSVDALTGQQAFDVMARLSGRFDMLVALDVGDRLMKLTGPHLLRPSLRSAISPWVLAGEPAVRGSRIQTATLASLSKDRALGVDDIVELYPTLTADDVADAIDLEARLAA